MREALKSVHTKGNNDLYCISDRDFISVRSVKSEVHEGVYNGWCA